MVHETKAALVDSRRDEYRRLLGGIENLNILVSRTALKRALLIMDALVRALEKRGCAVSIETQSWPGTKVVVAQQKIKIRLIEKGRRRPNPQPKKSKYDWGWRQSLYEPSGQLLFIIHEYSDSIPRKNWKDLDQRPLEDQLNDIAGIWTAAEVMRLDELARQVKEDQRLAEERTRIEKQRVREAEEARRREFEQTTDAWIKSQNLRTFIRACEEVLSRIHPEIESASTASKWLDWANAHADRIDPFRNGSWLTSLPRG